MSYWILDTHTNTHVGVHNLYSYGSEKRAAKYRLRQKTKDKRKSEEWDTERKINSPWEPYHKRLSTQLFVAVVKGFVHAVTVSVSFSHVLNDSGILMALVQLFWSLIWHCLNASLFNERNCRSMWKITWSCVPNLLSTMSGGIMEVHWRCSCVQMMRQCTITTGLGKEVISHK